MKSLVKDYAGLCVALACALLPAFFYLRTENAVMSVLERNGTLLVFIASLLAAYAALGCAMVFLPSFRRLSHRPVSIICSGILLAFGIYAAVAQENLTGVASWCASGVSGVLIAIGIVEMTGVCLALLAHHSHLRLLPFISAAFLLASLVWYVLMRIGLLVVECAVLGGLGIAGALLGAHVCRRAPREAKHDQSKPCDKGPSRRERAWFVFVIFGLLLNFFTMGLTFLPEAAGVASGTEAQMKPGSYALAALVSLVALVGFSREGTSDPHTLHKALFVCLALATAVVLVSPFIDTVLVESDFLLANFLPYAGNAMLNIIGWTAVVRFAQTLPSPTLATTGACMVGCAAAMATGMLVFFLTGTGGQKVSLTVLAFYLAGIIVFLVSAQSDPLARKNASDKNQDQNQNQGQGQDQNQNPDHDDSGKDICTKLAESCSLTPREQEVLAYLAQGHSARYIADRLVISPDTVRTHMKRIYKKCGIHTREELLDLING